MKVLNDTVFQQWLVSGPDDLENNHYALLLQLQLWIESPRQELTLESALSKVEGISNGTWFSFNTLYVQFLKAKELEQNSL